jgi:hypothetical protein
MPALSYSFIDGHVFNHDLHCRGDRALLTISAIYAIFFLIFGLFFGVTVYAPRDFSFWLHLSGLMAFWGGLTVQQGGGML